MSEALCGPSNPLQQFKQQSTVDRSLQQDRLTSRLSPSQGFRSPNPNAGLLDAQFEAFQAGVPLTDLPDIQPFQPQPLEPQPSGWSQSWASDFQRMQISSPPPFQQASFQPSPNTANWAEGFRSHLAQQAPKVQHSAPLKPLEFQQRARYGYSGFQPTFTPPVAFNGAVQQSKGKARVQDGFDEAAFERAFEQAKQDAAADLVALEQNSSQSASQAAQDTHLSAEKAEALWNEFGISLEAQTSMMAANVEETRNLQQDQETKEEAPQNDDDALAATAQELLEKVEHNQTDKFRNSQFLSLMRRLRDREVKVEGDKMVETNVSAPRASLHPSAYTTTTSLPLGDPSSSASTAAPSTPRSADGYHWDTHICRVPGCHVDHTFDHWESPAAAAASTTTKAARVTPLTPSSTSTAIPLFDNSEQRPSPLVPPIASGAIVDTRPPDYGSIPAHEQDADEGRYFHPADGQAVVDLLNAPITEADMGAMGEGSQEWPLSDVDPSQVSPLREGAPPFYADFRQLHGERTTTAGGAGDGPSRVMPTREETMEERVERIKLRVAELTGNRSSHGSV